MSQVTLTDKINQAISTLNEASGSSVPAIVKFVQSNFKGISAGNVKTELKRMVDSKALIRAKNSYKLSKEIKELLAKIKKSDASHLKVLAPPSQIKKDAKEKSVEKSQKKKVAHKKITNKKTTAKATQKKSKPQPFANIPAPVPESNSAPVVECPSAKKNQQTKKVVVPAKPKIINPKKKNF